MKGSVVTSQLPFSCLDTVIVFVCCFELPACVYDTV